MMRALIGALLGIGGFVVLLGGIAACDDVWLWLLDGDKPAAKFASGFTFGLIISAVVGTLVLWRDDA